MQIQPTNNGFDSTPRDLRSNEGSSRASSGEVIRKDNVHRSGPHSHTTELLGLLQDANNFTEVRHELVAKVQARLANGDYTSREAAEKTADKFR